MSRLCVEEIRLNSLCHLAQEALVELLSHLSTNKSFNLGKQSINTSADPNEAVSQILSQLHATNESSLIGLKDYTDIIFCPSGNVKEKIDVSSLDSQAIIRILQMNVSIFPTRSAKFRRNLKQLQCSNTTGHSKKCCVNCNHTAKNYILCAGCNASKTSCYVGNTVCCTLCNLCPNCNHNPCLNTKLRNCIAHIRKVLNLVCHPPPNAYIELRRGSFSHRDFSYFSWQELWKESCQMVLGILEYLINVEAMDRQTYEKKCFEINILSQWSQEKLFSKYGRTLFEICNQQRIPNKISFRLEFTVEKLKEYCWLLNVGFGPIEDLARKEYSYYSAFSKTVNKNFIHFFQQKLDPEDYGSYEANYDTVKMVQFEKDDIVIYTLTIKSSEYFDTDEDHDDALLTYKTPYCKESEALWCTLETHLKTVLLHEMGMYAEVICNGWQATPLELTTTFVKVKQEDWTPAEQVELDKAIIVARKDFKFKDLYVSSAEKVIRESVPHEERKICCAINIKVLDKTLMTTINDLVPQLQNSANKLKEVAGSSKESSKKGFAGN